MCIEGEFGFQDRAALVKLLMHFHFVARRGGQVIWVMDHPNNFENWIYDQFSGKNATALVQAFQKNDEVFGGDNRKMMADALLLVRKWSSDVEIRLATKNEKILEVVRCWFHLEDDDLSVVQKTAGNLLNGFKKISNACNTNRIIFSDLPQLRSTFNEEGTIGAVAEGERLRAIYLFEAFLKFGRRDQFGNIPKLWLCALTIVHELSHMLCNTADIFYDYQGLRVRKGFSTADALNNAESWAYFAADVVDALPTASRKKALKI
jgi:hypothetical protein